MDKTIYEAALSGEFETVKAHIDRGFDVATRNQDGLTALHCAAIGCNSTDVNKSLATINLLVKAGSPVNATIHDGRTALYLAAEFSPAVEPLRLLVDSGAEVDIRDSHGNHIVKNAKCKEVKEYLSHLTDYHQPPSRRLLESARLSARQWATEKKRVDMVFDELSRAGVVALQDAGTTQEDGFSDSTEEFLARGGVEAGLIGFCFITRQDMNRARRTSQLPVGFWGAPDGEPQSMIRVGRQVVRAFRSKGFAVEWDDTPTMRPIVLVG